MSTTAPEFQDGGERILRRVEGFKGIETAKYNQRVVAILGDEQRDGFYRVRTVNEPIEEFCAKSTNLVALGELGENDGEMQCSVPTAVADDIPQEQKTIVIAPARPLSHDEAVSQMLEFVPQRTRPPNYIPCTSQS